MGEFPVALFAWLENTPIALWVREALWAFPLSIIVHAWAMALLVGISLLLALGALGVAPRLLLPLAEKSKPFIWIAFFLSLISGVLLLLAYPAKALTNEVFYLKLVLIGVALTLDLSVVNQCKNLSPQHEAVLPAKLRLRAAGILLAWFGAIAAGRLLAYTYSVLTVT
jgi:hypothetical protein